MSNGAVILARVSRPCCHRNALRVYSAEARDFFRDLKRGYLARLAKNAANAACWCRRACCSGTLLTSFRNPRSSPRFHWVSRADACT